MPITKGNLKLKIIHNPDIIAQRTKSSNQSITELYLKKRCFASLETVRNCLPEENKRLEKGLWF